MPGASGAVMYSVSWHITLFNIAYWYVQHCLLVIHLCFDEIQLGAFGYRKRNMLTTICKDYFSKPAPYIRPNLFMAHNSVLYCLSVYCSSVFL